MRDLWARAGTARWVFLFALAVALLVAGWLWVARGLTEPAVVVPGTFESWTQTSTRPDVTDRTDGTYDYTCPDDLVVGTKLPMGDQVIYRPQFPNPEQLPEFVACFRHNAGTEAVVESRLVLPAGEDLLIALGAGVMAYFVAVGFVLSTRALAASSRQQ